VYVPGLSGWLSADSVTPDVVWSANGFRYVRGNPLRYVDPSGHMEGYDPYAGGDFEPDASKPEDIQALVQAELFVAGFLIPGPEELLLAPLAGAIKVGARWFAQSRAGRALGRLFKRGLGEETLEAIDEIVIREAGDVASDGAERTVTVSRRRHPESAAHVEDAQANGHPSTLTVDRTGATARRRDSLRDVERRTSLDRDEYPPAMFEEGGKGASVRHLDPSDNRGAGACIGHQCRGLPDGARVRVEVED
jgi:hypothetical protein